MRPRRRTALNVAAALMAAGLLAGACSPGEESAAQAEPSPQAFAGDALQETEPGELLALTCSGCHGGGSEAIPDYSQFDQAELETKLKTYKAEMDGTTVMHRLMRGYSDADITAVAAYLSAQHGSTP